MKVQYFEDTDTLYIEFQAGKNLGTPGFGREHSS